MILAPYQFVLPLGTQYLMGVPLSSKPTVFSPAVPATGFSVQFFLSLSNLEPATLGASALTGCSVLGTEQVAMQTALAAYYTGVLTVAALNAALANLVGQVIYTCAQVIDQYWSAIPTLVQAAQ